MSGQIRMTPETMKARAGEYTKEAEKVKAVIMKMDKLLKTLQQEWEGAASESYAERYNELRPSFENAESLINEISAALTSTAKIVAETDSNIANQFKG